jgi:membrane protease YdiL (CAAX protease family)
MNNSNVEAPNMTVKSLRPFLALTFGLTWGIAALLIFFTDQVVSVFGEISSTNPLFILAVYSPGLAGVFWRMPLVWWLFLIVGIPALAYLSASLNATISDPFPFSPWYLVVPALGHAFFLGTIEEFGWRGVALPLLQRRLAPFWAGLVVGIIWGVWHLPAFLMSGLKYGGWSVVPFLGGTIALSVILTPMFNSSRGSLLIAYLYHFQIMNPIIPDSQPWDSLVFGLAAVVIVVLNRRTMFTKGTGVTEVLMPEASEGISAQQVDPDAAHQFERPVANMQNG